ncbi:uncharacterized protein SPSK_08139 [Sporothrix schenckii 1099-18]|uniref:Uncharacterized protein n=1 Tax=Sporothrix schenckii 1099-18 TaxID=1397361 RepID=A0A0F2MEB9_SPOSC|nr:uncharacterized protein SPSK_08139 [Sporothrix schenckii 1099-18]KJR88023.1 hypothetical protein SPSK_08139 [Sporothrix schenckii 1099-18]
MFIPQCEGRECPASKAVAEYEQQEDDTGRRAVDQVFFYQNKRQNAGNQSHRGGQFAPKDPTTAPKGPIVPVPYGLEERYGRVDDNIQGPHIAGWCVSWIWSDVF